MILEQAILEIKPGQEDEFVGAIEEAKSIITSMPECLEFSVSRGIESPGSFLLLVKWETLEDHTVGFRQSPEYLEWKRRLHHFYDPFPVVEHFEAVVEG